ncbi:hypothetical protein DL95DRAFT_461366 [Leptodontidium sp. 2 PMI_412]|nr:hypothetical protein DL95DRAFT_461366 [Leptodontidium sp. 2 PMI_412]
MSFTAFRKPGMKEDVHLEVLHTYFTAYSVFLKQHSKFFLKFLDSPNKARPATVPADEFVYYWVTIKFSYQDYGPYRGRKKEQISAFKQLLCVMHNNPITFNSMDGLDIMTQLADYYCTLPVLSRVLTNAMLRKPLNIAQHAVLGLEIGSQLRNADLVRDCVCYLSGRWDLHIHSLLRRCFSTHGE